MSEQKYSEPSLGKASRIMIPDDDAEGTTVCAGTRDYGKFRVVLYYFVTYLSRILITQALGWGTLIVAAGVSYYYARKDINERRQLQEAAGSRPADKLDWRSKIERENKPKPNANQSPSLAPIPGASPLSAPVEKSKGGPS
ncbi:hypothetical protein A0H81_12704 [Grifola frondosa]|uniref:Uncharacterized protein n=1 Tax=Grifola frondosa TaxID=5627 RepID=A0A1C7LRD9_GRIFR|nr:hypothetical protein A0H81_12704 [Grifola frondosa]